MSRGYKYLFKDAFAVIGKAGQGPVDNPYEWVGPLWARANAGFPEIAALAIKDANGAPSVWGAMNDVTEANKRWDNSGGKYLAGVEADIDAAPPEGWTKWIIPAQHYLVAETTMDAEYGKVFAAVVNDASVQIIAAVHERYPRPDNPSIVELWFPIKK